VLQPEQAAHSPARYFDSLVANTKSSTAQYISMLTKARKKTEVIEVKDDFAKQSCGCCCVFVCD
jgi:hypothetical protein